MQDIKNLVRIAYKIQEILAGLNQNHYLELMKELATFAGQLKELASQSKKIGASLKNGWFSAAGQWTQ